MTFLYLLLLFVCIVYGIRKVLYSEGFINKMTNDVTSYEERRKVLERNFGEENAGILEGIEQEISVIEENEKEIDTEIETLKQDIQNVNYEIINQKNIQSSYNEDIDTYDIMIDSMKTKIEQ